MERNDRNHSGSPDRSARESLGGSRTITDRERSPEDGMQGVAEERGRMGGYGYDTPADLQQATDAENAERSGTSGSAPDDRDGGSSGGL